MKYSVITKRKSRSFNSFEKALKWVLDFCEDMEDIRICDAKTGKVLRNWYLDSNYGPSNRYGVEGMENPFLPEARK
jgi:hypothetical protein